MQTDIQISLVIWFCRWYEWWDAGVVICWGKVQICIWPSLCHCHSLSLASVKSKLVLSFWYCLSRVVQDKGLLNGCCCCCC